MSVQFSVEDVRLLKIQYSLLPDLEPIPEEQENAEVPVPVDIVCSSNYDESNRLLRVILSAKLKDPKPLFVLDTEVGGVFRLDSDPDKQELEMIRHVNCPAIIFPYLREIVSEITRRGGFPPVYLPPMNFADAFRKQQKIEA
jgi:preprotein translocase subunit SecB